MQAQCASLDAVNPSFATDTEAAIGGGLGLALVADFRFASPEARFSANFSPPWLSSGVRFERHVARTYWNPSQ